MTIPVAAAPGEQRGTRLGPLVAEMAARSQLATEHPDAPGICRSVVSALYSMIRGSFAAESLATHRRPPPERQDPAVC